MNKTIHRAESRGYADHGWLQTHHTFSFANYYDPRRVHFGALRVLNDDTVAPGEGFGTHPHDNMEIVSIALEGALRHGDSMGNMKVLRPGEIQVMSAGTGITHSEMNASETEPVKFLQIWVLTDAQNHTPRYNQVELAPAKRNVPHVIVAPEGRGGEHVGWVHQDAWFYTLDLDKDHVAEYRMNTRGHGAYVFVIEGGRGAGTARRHGHHRGGRVPDQGRNRREGVDYRSPDGGLTRRRKGAFRQISSSSSSSCGSGERFRMGVRRKRAVPWGSPFCVGRRRHREEGFCREGCCARRRCVRIPR